MMNPKEFISKNKTRFLDELFELLKIQSVSADPKFRNEVKKAANYLVDQFNILGLDNVEKIETECHPIVYAEKIINPNYITILVYDCILYVLYSDNITFFFCGG